MAILHPAALAREEVRELVDQGMQVFAQPARPAARSGRLTVFRRILSHWSADHRTLKHCLLRLKNPHVFINQGGSFDILAEPHRLSFLQNPEVTYDLFFRSNQHQATMPKHRRERAANLFARAHRCLLNSAWTKELTETQLLSRLSNAAIFPHYIRFSYDTPLPWPKTESNAPIALASISRMDAHHKGLDVLLEALALLPPERPSWRFDFYGDGPDRAYLEELADWLGLGSKVRFMPHTNDIHSIWRRHHLLVLTSRYEGLAVSMLEAMACGRPVRRTPYGGFREWVIPGETGFNCPAAEPTLIAQSLIAAMANRNKWSAMGLAAFNRVRDKLPRDPWSLYLTPFAAPQR
ncbi:MAG: glycosyltransferase [Candidatus Synoicihabitans palmerolidicus]|nr:glycosyltransferase [Candidatus Synoicihabitans palmerolidicus]